MGNRRARTDKEIIDRRNEIVNACISVALEKGFNNINIKEISQITSFSRTAIYTYYKSKEEVFLDILRNEYTALFKELKQGISTVEKNNKELFSDFLSSKLMKYDNLLMLLSKHIDEIENNCRIENLSAYKEYIAVFFTTFEEMTKATFPNSDDKNIELFRILFFASIGSLYNLAHPSEKQIMALQTTNLYRDFDFYDICYKHTLLIANSL